MKNGSNSLIMLNLIIAYVFLFPCLCMSNLCLRLKKFLPILLPTQDLTVYFSYKSYKTHLTSLSAFSSLSSVGTEVEVWRFSFPQLSSFSRTMIVLSFSFQMVN